MCPLYCDTGLSPQARGNRDLLLKAYSVAGSIPAGVGGNRLRIGFDHALVRVYPRRRGGTANRPCRLVPFGIGVYPRRRGGTSYRCSTSLNHGCGSIPAGAGEPWTVDRLAIGSGRGSIPAGAGEPLLQDRLRVATPAGVYPRRRGGTSRPVLPCRDRRRTGLSPQARGNQSPSYPPEAPNLGVYPRRRGGTALRLALRGGGSRVYPRRRGGTFERRWPCSRNQKRVYPRRRGGTASTASRRASMRHSGLSPQGAGEPLAIN